MAPATSQSTARDVFAHLLMIIVLFMSVISLLTVLFQLLNIQFPDFANGFEAFYARDTLRGGLATLIIAWPVFVLISWFLEKDLRAAPEKIDLWVRRWLLHLTLFVAALTIIIDLVTLVNGFLNGELTIRFFLKVIFTLLVAGVVFAYYLWQLKRDAKEVTKLPLMTAISSTTLVLIVIIVSFVVGGTPAEQRRLRLDQIRVSDLGSIQYQILSHLEQEKVLPDGIADLEGEQPVDPETGEAYVYNKTSEYTFELCATFATKGDERSDAGAIYPRPVTAPLTERAFSDAAFQDWTHEVGSTCFEREIDPEWMEDTEVK